ncbi:flavin reductase family protein [Idiomarina xiamenensis]|uniref:Flavoprotein oxygenase domain-containing protein n=1 Tax=Idiomarina xiamenensis 10-D-4 TaxID=740709 RepID=K2L1P9_9GAMM|nr:flavin reductase [Idiomarina xiamenensis]EKE83740.1 flavoprotein oxygenase domain-containing protein [Idiomarina xiamenensis 10-D-4]
MKCFKLQDLADMDDTQRAHFVNGLPGFKSANLIGTKDRHQQTNLAIVSSVIHLGSNPPMLGFMTRPHSVERHTLENIEETGVYTINQVHSEILEAAHQTSARYPRKQSEFEACQLSEDYVDGFHAPHVKESRLSCGLKLIEVMPIQHNGTALVVGEVEWVQIDETAVADDGFIDHQQLASVAISGLDSYHKVEAGTRLNKAETDQPPSRLTANAAKVTDE